MRVSSDASSPYYNRAAIVCLDGVRVDNIMEADTDEGWVEVRIGGQSAVAFGNVEVRPKGQVIQ